MVAARYYEQSNIVTKWSKISSTCYDPVSLVLWYVQAPNNQQSNTLSGKKNIVPLFTQLQHSMQYIRQMSITLQNYQLILQNCHKLAKIFIEVSSNL